jgi:hypothetical protein
VTHPLLPPLLDSPSCRRYHPRNLPFCKQCREFCAQVIDPRNNPVDRAPVELQTLQLINLHALALNYLTRRWCLSSGSSSPMWLGALHPAVPSSASTFPNCKSAPREVSKPRQSEVFCQVASSTLSNRSDGLCAVSVPTFLKPTLLKSKGLAQRSICDQLPEMKEQRLVRGVQTLM